MHNALDGCVQRKDYLYLKEVLPKKSEYVLSIRLSPKQVELYNIYLEKENFAKIGGAKLFSDFQNLSRVWTHPWALKLNENRLIKKEVKLKKKKEEESFISSSDASETSSDNISLDSKEINDDDDDIIMLDDDDIIMLDADDQQVRGKTPINGGGINENGSNEQFNGQEQVTQRWWSDVKPECENDMNLSGKLVLLEKILKCCKEKGDKL